MAFACSVAVNQQWVGNEMVSATANRYNVDLTKVENVKVESFTKEFFDFDSVSQCPLQVVMEAKVTLVYKPNFMRTCEVEVVTRFTDEVNGSEREKEFLNGSKSCVRNLRKLPRRIHPRRILIPQS